jgi:signal transduction histidine kinase
MSHSLESGEARVEEELSPTRLDPAAWTRVADEVNLACKDLVLDPFIPLNVRTSLSELQASLSMMMPGGDLSFADQAVFEFLAATFRPDPVVVKRRSRLDLARRIHDVRNLTIVLLSLLERPNPTGTDLEHSRVIVQKILSVLDGQEGAPAALFMHFEELSQIFDDMHLRYGDPTKIPFYFTGKEIPLSTMNLSRLLINLIDNAKKAGATEVQFSFDVEGNSLVIHLLDNGPGFPAEPFASRPNAATGHGYGLDECKTLCEKAGGSLSRGSLRGESGWTAGAEWTIRLPLNEARDPQ